MDVTITGQPGQPGQPGQEPPPGARRSRRPLMVLAVLVLGLVTADQVRAVQARDDAAVRLVLVGAAALPVAALPAAALPAAALPVVGSASGAQDAVVALTLRNDGPRRVQVLEQRLDGGGPTDPGPSLAAGASVVLRVRWRVLCDEVGSLFGPQALDLVVRTRLRAVRPVQVRLGPATGPVRQVFRSSAADGCAALR